MRPDVMRWLAGARADAEARGLRELLPLLDALARSTDALREADASLTGGAPTSAGPDGPAQPDRTKR